MKKRKYTPVARKPKKLKSVKHAFRKHRPIHKRILLHPVSVFMMLCVGVFLVGWTIKTFAQNITVTASVLAPLPSQPATIIKPINKLHTTSSSIKVSGNCQSNTYVKLFVNGNFSGAAICGNHVTTYSILTNLIPGSNQLQVRAFNITNNEGPESSPVTVHYDTPKQSPAPIPSVPPKTLVAHSLDSLSIVQGIVHRISVLPTVRGTAPPYSQVTVTFHSTPTTCITYADSYGNWSCTLDQSLQYGTHTIDYAAITPTGEKLTYPSIKMVATSYIAPLQPPETLTPPFVINHTYRYRIYASDIQYSWDMSLSNGTAPYALTVNWGDGNTSTIARNNTDAFQITHTYSLLNTTSAYYSINVKAVDSAGEVTSMQLPALVTIDGKQLGVIKNNVVQASQAFIKRWVWMIWPIYVIVLLMTTSFWLGEREEYLKLLKTTRLKRRR